MKRLLTATHFDARMQVRYGFLVAAGGSILVWVAVLLAFPPDVRRSLTPAIIYLDLALVGFFFIAGLVLYEKDEATILALVITPLRFGEYLAARLITLTLLANAIALALVLLTGSAAVNLALVVLGTTLMSLISLLIGFIAVTPFPSFSSYLIPSQRQRSCCICRLWLTSASGRARSCICCRHMAQCCYCVALSTRSRHGKLLTPGSTVPHGLASWPSSRAACSTPT
ncbi:hypothetical protein HC891_07120 [Candidatus Gracilibacteria bacterium]|nr:hypothetical protein [Candidatus Gracilibacteria bacterium]